jgi:hypothetical protein
VSAKLTTSLPIETILDAVCVGIHEALGFGKVTVELFVDDSAVSQYVEQVPAAGGPKAPGVGPRGKPRPLTAAVRTQLMASGGADAQVLDQLATSPDLGAPARQGHAQGRVIRPSEDRSSASDSLSAAVTAVGEGGGARFAILGVLLIGITVAVLGSARRRVRA